MQELPLLTVPTELDDTGCISQCGTTNRAAHGAGSSSSNSAFHSTSFTWPLNGSDPSEPKMPVVGPCGWATINPLANAIDVRSLGSSRVRLEPAA
jgi:hypothetical protein